MMQPAETVRLDYFADVDRHKMRMHIQCYCSMVKKYLYLYRLLNFLHQVGWGVRLYSSQLCLK